MNTSGITRGVAATAIAALAVAGLPLLTSPAHAAVTTVEINNLRGRVTFDLDELRDGDDFRIVTRDGLTKVDATLTEFRWIIEPTDGGTTVTGEWLPAEHRTTGTYRVAGPSRTGGDDGITDAEVVAGTWTLEARADGVDAGSVDVDASESEIALEAPVAGAGATQTVRGTLENATDPLEGRVVKLTYDGAGDARIQGSPFVLTGTDGSFEVTLEDPNGATGQTGLLTAAATGEDEGPTDDPSDDDQTQLKHDTGPNDTEHPDADATDEVSLTWEGPVVEPIVATLEGRSNGARADVLKVVAPSKARGAQVRLFRVSAGGALTRLKTSQLNSQGDKKFRVNDRNRRRSTTYVAKVGQTATTLADETNRRRVR